MYLLQLVVRKIYSASLKIPTPPPSLSNGLSLRGKIATSCNVSHMFSHYSAGWSLVCVLVSDGLITLFVTIAIGLLYHHIFDSAGLAFYSACIAVRKVLNVNFHMKQARQARFKKP